MRGGWTGRPRTRAGLLVLAKAPLAGRVKTRLCPPASPITAARIAAAALLDTLEAVAGVPGATALVALSGNLAGAERQVEIAAALAETTRYPQRGDLLGERIAAAHADAASLLPGRPVVQIGMDTPQLGPSDLSGTLDPLTARRGPDAVLGPAADGGWWALGLRDPRAASVIAGVPTSRDDTGARTLHALRSAGLSVRLLDERRDVDTVEDALAVATDGAGARFTAEVLTLLGTLSGIGPAVPAPAGHLR